MAAEEFSSELVSASSQSIELQERLVRVAYGLHFSLANLALLYQSRADDAGQPQHAVFIREAARCRAASDRAMDIVKAWEHGHSPAAVSVVCPHCDDRLPLSSVCGIDVTLPPEQIEVCAASCPQCHGSVKLMLLLTG